MQTIARKNKMSKEKIPEVARFLEFMSFFNVDYKQLAEKIDIPWRSITNYTWNNKPIGEQILRKVHATYGVSIDWIISGTGEMLAHAEAIDDLDDLVCGQKQDALFVSEQRVSYGSRLIDTRLNVDSDAMSDMYLLYAATIEQAFLDAGAVSGRDYVMLDLFKLAQAHVLMEANKNTLTKVMFTETARK